MKKTSKKPGASAFPKAPAKPRTTAAAKPMPSADKDDCTVYISNLSYHLDRDQLKKLFSNFGEVKQVKLVMDLETEKSKGMAFIRMAEPAQAKKAISALNKQIIDGRTVKVSYAIPMKGAQKFRPKEETKQEAEAAKKESKEKEKKKKKGPVPLATFLAERAAKKKS